MLVLEDDLVIVVEVPGEGGQSERGGKSEYLMGRKSGLFASVSAGRIKSLTRTRSSEGKRSQREPIKGFGLTRSPRSYEVIYNARVNGSPGLARYVLGYKVLS